MCDSIALRGGATRTINLCEQSLQEAGFTGALFFCCSVLSLLQSASVPLLILLMLLLLLLIDPLLLSLLLLLLLLLLHPDHGCHCQLSVLLLPFRSCSLAAAAAISSIADADGPVVAATDGSTAVADATDPEL